ncbi:MAG TPA: hypothetical protein VE961_06415, partial [Pyrinomonadaceae bacterium]|nr:hypothetical protein [Pyrinomonadaceae bacterium]
LIPSAHADGTDSGMVLTRGWYRLGDATDSLSGARSVSYSCSRIDSNDHSTCLQLRSKTGHPNITRQFTEVL